MKHNQRIKSPSRSFYFSQNVNEELNGLATTTTNFELQSEKFN